MKILLAKIQFIATELILLIISWISMPFIIAGKGGAEALGQLIAATITFPFEILKIIFISKRKLQYAIRSEDFPGLNWFLRL